MERKKLILLDTGPLRELITYQAVFRLRFRNLRKELQFIRESIPYEMLAAYLRSFQNVSTTPSVIAELGRWIQKTGASGQERLWSLVYDELRALGLEEQMVKLLDMPRELVARCGPADVSLLTLAREQLASEPVVLTIDWQLYAEGLNAQVRAVQIQEIIGQPSHA
jgi:hypothetical protein